MSAKDLPLRRRMEEDIEAERYASAILQGFTSTDWASWNAEIMRRWSKTALIRVKTRAWQIVDASRG